MRIGVGLMLVPPRTFIIPDEPSIARSARPRMSNGGLINKMAHFSSTAIKEDSSGEERSKTDAGVTPSGSTGDPLATSCSLQLAAAARRRRRQQHQPSQH